MTISNNHFAAICIAIIIFLEIALGISPQSDRMTWAMENAPVWIGIAAWLWTKNQFQLSKFCITLFCIHAIILMIGGYYTYAKVPLGFWAKDWFELSRNNYDRLGHFAQGFIPAIFIRELLLRVAKLPQSRWITILTICACLAFSAFYELIEWWTAIFSTNGASDFLGTQGDPWDTQWDMFCALCGAIISQMTLQKVHDRSIKIAQ